MGSTKSQSNLTKHSILLIPNSLSNKLQQEAYRVTVTQLSIYNQNYAPRFRSAWVTDLRAATKRKGDRQ